jgi:hypothetical protein
MKTIELDDEIYDYVLSKAIPYEDKTMNDTIRRLIGFDKKAIPQRPITLPQEKSPMIVRQKKAKASLVQLVNAGVLKEGQILHMRDYQGREIPDSKATIHRRGLLRDGQKYSMSGLAAKFLKKQGSIADSFRGPSYWFTSDNISIRNLWESYSQPKK